MAVSILHDAPLKRSVLRALARAEGDAFGVVANGRAGSERVETWRLVDGQGDALRAELALILARGRRETRCPAAREAFAVAQVILARYEQFDRAEDEHVGCAGGHLGLVVGHGLRVVAAHESILTGGAL